MGEIRPRREGLDMEEIEKEFEDLNGATWEGLVPRLSLRVLLVEGDDCTRQIIAALLKKCNYIVSAVSDGLKAWEVLMHKPQKIDLVLTEIQLPEISGFSLLSMIMGHESFKNIPVIIMSSQDSMSTVFKFMIMGASDFLIKPVRKNELRNLWQHVWRRQALTGLQLGCQKDRLRMGGTSRNCDLSTHSSDSIATLQKYKDYCEKGSDSQNSCTRPDVEDESASLNKKNHSLPRSHSSLTADSSLQTCIERSEHGDTTLMEEDNNAEEGNNRLVATTHGKEDSDMMDESSAFISKSGRAVLPGETIDLIGTIGNATHLNCQHTEDSSGGISFSRWELFSNKKDNSCNFSSPPLLDLCLRRPCHNVNQETEEHHSLNHSNASAFSRYNSETLQRACPVSSSFNQRPYLADNSFETSASQVFGVPVNTFHGNGVQQTHTKEDGPHDSRHLSQHVVVRPCAKLGVISVSSPCDDFLHDGLHSDQGKLPHSMFQKYSAAPPEPPPWKIIPTALQEPLLDSCLSYSHLKDEHHPSKQKAENCSQEYGTLERKNSNEDPRCIHSDPVESGSSSVHDDSRQNQVGSRLESIHSRNADGINAFTIKTADSEHGNVGHSITGDQVGLDHQLVSRREAALTKFRMKRKERCYEKKVRYQSRKKLAEQRPRLKGQFVRQVQSQCHGQDQKAIGL